MRYLLKVGHKSINGQVEIVDADSLCYIVKSTSKGAAGFRTISKKLLAEYIDYFEKYPNNTAAKAREDLVGHSEIDRFEYGYTSTLTTLAKMALGEELSDEDKYSADSAIDSDQHQVIYYGAPGTGKSHSVDKIIDSGADNFQRVTFHPDTDYSSFVGCYKPTKDDETGKLTYDFVGQPFLMAYIEAWKRLAAAPVAAKAEPYYLIIEEINRGNCAQIFGDIFQLLDRRDGFSKYSIHPDTDIKRYLKCAFEDVNIPSGYSKIKSGEEMRLPSNLFIYATMNTSDQSLFPIDSAFKRRWEWKYTPISNGNKGYIIAIGDTGYDWYEFIKTINKRIYADTNSEDKQMGYWFVHLPDGRRYIKQETFISKVLFYLWSDIYKDFGKGGCNIFQGEDEAGNKYPLPFHEFFAEDIEDGEVVRAVVDKIHDFMRHNKISSQPLPEEMSDEEAQIEDDMTDATPKSDYEIHWGKFIDLLRKTSVNEQVPVGRLPVPKVRQFELKCADLPDCKVGASIASAYGYLRIYFWSGFANQDIVRPLLESHKEKVEAELTGIIGSPVRFCGRNVLAVESKRNGKDIEWQANTFAAFYDYFSDLLEEYSPDFDSNDDGNKRDTSRYSLNGVGSYKKCYLASETVKAYVALNPDATVQDVVQVFSDISNKMSVNVPNLIEDEATFEKRIASSRDQRVRLRAHSVECADGKVYVTSQWNSERIQSFIDTVHDVQIELNIVKVK